MEIVRQPTTEELTDFKPIEDTSGRILTPEDRFLKRLSEEQLKANKVGLPFAAALAKEEWKEAYEEQVRGLKRKYGYVKVDELKEVKIDWARYSDLKNFDLLEEYEKIDDYWSKRMNKNIAVKCRKYQFKGHYRKIDVMEDVQTAINRIKDEEAQEKADRVEKKLKK